MRLPKMDGWGFGYEKFHRVAQSWAIVGVPAAAEHAADGSSAPTDLNGKSDYRDHLARVMTRRAVLAAAGEG